MQLTLAVRLEDNRGHVVDRTYPARGSVIIDGHAAATMGLTIPGMSSFDHAKALEVTWPGNANALAIELRLDPGINPDFRRPIAGRIFVRYGLIRVVRLAAAYFCTPHSPT